jgi:3-oxoacyl-[acyl-carrier-protein] synthase-3
MGIKISAIEYFLPSKVINNKFLVESLGFEINFIENKLGIRERHHTKSEEGCAMMASEAVKKLIGKNNISLGSIDLIVTVTQNPDFKLPNVSPLLQNSLGLDTRVASFDLNLGCSGFVYALAVVKGLMATNNFQRALIVTSDPYSKIISLKDRITVPLFGDAAAAALIDTCQHEYVGSFDFGTDGSGAEALIVRSGGSKYPRSLGDEQSNYLFMDGRAIYNFMMKTVPVSVERCLKANNLTESDIDYYVFHQASKYMLQALMKRMRISESKMVFALSFCGNTVSSSIPIALNSLMQSERNYNKRVLLSGFGVGLSWASVIIKI